MICCILYFFVARLLENVENIQFDFIVQCSIVKLDNESIKLLKLKISLTLGVSINLIKKISNEYI